MESNNSETGFQSALYQNNETGEYTYAFAGANPDERGDVDAIWQQMYGGSEHHAQAISNARRISRGIRLNGGGDLSFTGHSAGGSMAAMSAWAMRDPDHREAKTYDAESVSIFTFARTARNVFGGTDVQNYYLAGRNRDGSIETLDPLTRLNQAGWFLGMGVGQQIPVILTTPGRYDFFGMHSIETISRELNK